MAFKFKKIHAKNEWPNMNKPVIEADAVEPLSGFFNGLPAKRDEEFFMTEVESHPNVRNVEFRVPLGEPKGMPGWLELDGLIETYNGYRAFELDDLTFVHSGTQKQADMKLKDVRRVEGLQKKGIAVRQIEHVDASKLTTRDDTRRVVGSLQL